MTEPVAVGQVRRRPLFGGMVADHEVAAVRGDLVALYPTLDASATWEYADIVASWPLVLPLPEPSTWYVGERLLAEQSRTGLVLRKASSNVFASEGAVLRVTLTVEERLP